MDTMCEDFLAFEDVLKNLRKLDDNIVHALNTSLPTQSFSSKGVNPTEKCRELYNQMHESHLNRERAIKNCIVKVSETVHRLKKERDTNPDNMQIMKDLRREQSKLRMMQNELNVEEVIRDRSVKYFHEKCRHYYRPEDC